MSALGLAIWMQPELAARGESLARVEGWLERVPSLEEPTEFSEALYAIIGDSSTFGKQDESLFAGTLLPETMPRLDELRDAVSRRLAEVVSVPFEAADLLAGAGRAPLGVHEVPDHVERAARARGRGVSRSDLQRAVPRLGPTGSSGWCVTVRVGGYRVSGPDTLQAGRPPARTRVLPCRGAPRERRRLRDGLPLQPGGAVALPAPTIPSHRSSRTGWIEYQAASSTSCTTAGNR